MFSRVRWRLLAWNTLVLVLLLTVIGGAVYIGLSRSLRAEVDRNLASRSAETTRQLHEMREHGVPFEGVGYRGGLFFVLIGPNGQVIANPQNVDPTTLPAPLAVGAMPRYTTLTLASDPTRLYVQPIMDPRFPAGTLIVGESLRPQQDALHRLLLILFIGGGVGVLLALIGAWFLAGRALVPIQHAFARQQEFVADAAHELRTPLTVLHAATDLLQQHQDEPLRVNSELLADVREEISRMERLTDELLTLARSDRQMLELATGQVDFAALTADVTRRLLPVAQQHGITLATVGDDIPLYLEADPDRLQQVLMILLDNALAHTPSGGRVTAKIAHEGRDAVVAIHDTGVGIPAEHLPRIFNRFYRVDRARTRGDSTGLGLAIAQAIVQAHGGHLTLTSAADAGTTATVRMPIETRAHAPDGAVRRLVSKATKG